MKVAEKGPRWVRGTGAIVCRDATKAAQRLQQAGADLMKLQGKLIGDPGAMNFVLRNAERAFLGDGLPDRPWFKHVIYVPGEHTGYAAAGDSPE